MQDQWFYLGWVPPQKHSRDRVSTPAPCIVHLASGRIGPHGRGMLLAASVSVARFGPPPPLPSRPVDAARYQPGIGTGINEKRSEPWSMARIFGDWYKSNAGQPGVLICPVCLRPMRRLLEGGLSSTTAPQGRLWVTVDHIIHIEHEECHWCVWPMCNECNSSKGTADLHEWLAQRLQDLGQNVDSARARVRAARDAILDGAPEGQSEPHDCDNAAPFRKSFGCAAGAHDWMRYARGRSRCRRKFCGALGAWDLSVKHWRATGQHGHTCGNCGTWPDECECAV